MSYTDIKGVPLGSLYQGLQYAEIDISSAEILNIGGSPVSLLIQSPAGTYHDIVKWIVEYTDNGVAYDCTGIDYFMIEETLSSASCKIWTGMFTMGVNNISIPVTFPIIDNGVDTILSISVQEQTEYRFWTNTGLSPTLGTGTVKIKCWYIIRTL